MANTSVVISQIFKSRQIVLQLMEKQGYNVSDYSNFSLSEVITMQANNQLDMLLESKEPSSAGGNKAYVRYYLEKTVRPANIHAMIDDLYVLSETLTKNDVLYIIIKGNANETLINELKHIWERDGIFIVVENIKYLQYNIHDHILVPPHTIINESKVNEIMIKYNITDKSQFPDISRFDPVARSICMRPGQVCHIVRPSKTAIEADYYRICV